MGMLKIGITLVLRALIAEVGVLGGILRSILFRILTRGPKMVLLSMFDERPFSWSSG